MKSSSTALLGHLVTVVGGGTPARGNPEFYGGPIPWVTPKDMKSRMISGAQMSITEDAIRNSAAKLIPSDAVLVVVRSGVLKHSLPVGLTTVPVAINQDMKALVCTSSLHPPFLAYLLTARAPEVLSWVRATTADNFSIDLLKGLPIPLPPLAEQRRIADILDKADALRAARRAALATLDLLKRSLFHHMFGGPASNPSNRPVTTLGELATFTGGGTPSRERRDFFSGTICWATPKDLRGEFVDDTQEHITEDAVVSSATKLVPQGTVLVVVKSKVLMHRLPVAIARTPVCFSQDLKGVTAIQGVSSLFIAAAIKAQEKRLLEMARGANTEGLTLQHLNALPLVLPPKHQQDAFDRATKAVDAVRRSAEAHAAAADFLFASLQHRAFRGEL